MNEKLIKACADERLSNGAFRMLFAMVLGVEMKDLSRASKYHLRSEINDCGYSTDCLKNETVTNETSLKNETVTNDTDKNDTTPISTIGMTIDELKCAKYLGYLKDETITPENLEKVRTFIDSGLYKEGNTDEGVGVLGGRYMRMVEDMKKW